MAEVEDVTSDISLNADSDGGFGEWATGVAENTPVVETALKGVETVTNIRQGLPDDPDAGDIMLHAGNVATDTAGFVAECATEAATVVLDPIGWLVGHGLDLVLHLVTPLQDALRFVTGDGPRLSEAADDFTAIGEGLVAYSEEFARVADEALQDWTGEASRAARSALAEFASGIQGVATSSGGVAQVLKGSSMLMQVIEEVLKAIITELVTWLVMIWVPALASSVVSLGSSVAAAMSASVAKATATFSRVTAKLGKLGKLLDEILAFFQKFGSAMVKLGEKLGVKRNGFADTVGEITASVARNGAAGAMREGLVSSLKAGGGKLAEQIIGLDPASPPGMTGGETGKAISDHYGTLVDHLRDGKDYADQGRLGSGAPAEETEEQLRM